MQFDCNNSFCYVYSVFDFLLVSHEFVMAKKKVVWDVVEWQHSVIMSDYWFLDIALDLDILYIYTIYSEWKTTIKEK